ncbi:MAG: type 3 dihydrofolate reductase [Woeseiaceae bacterium]|nr:type 3 dihydrofolate reductase [Woeseiaceae bacterium]
MKISLIVAASNNNVIGLDGELPWHLSEDLKRFKVTTMGKPMIMGRATFASIGRALPGRKSIVMSQQKAFVAEGCDVASSVEQAIACAGDVDEIMVIGGGKIYELFLPIANRIYLTRVDAHIEGDTFFPTLDTKSWSTIESEDFSVTDQQEFGFRIETLERL